MTEPSTEARDLSQEEAPIEALVENSSIDSEIVTDRPKGSYVKYAMRNMVRKRGTSLKHFFLTVFGVLGLLVGLAYITR
jgi:hypothetical protein